MSVVTTAMSPMSFSPMRKEMKEIDWEGTFERVFNMIKENLPIIESAFTKRCGFPVKFTVEMQNYRHCTGGHLIYLKSSSVMNGFGNLAKLMFRDIWIDMYCAPVLNDKYEVESFCMTPTFRYDHPRGGSNGCSDACIFRDIRIVGGELKFNELEMVVGSSANFTEHWESDPNEVFDNIDKAVNEHRMVEALGMFPTDYKGDTIKSGWLGEKVYTNGEVSIYKHDVGRDGRFYCYYKTITL